jgi:hypothetical protein
MGMAVTTTIDLTGLAVDAAGDIALAVTKDAPAAQRPTVELVCPVTGEVIDLDNVDAMLDAFERAKAFQTKLYAVVDTVRLRLGEIAAKAHADTAAGAEQPVTSRVRGERRRAKLTLPDVGFDQKILKEIVAAFPPELVAPVVQPASYKVGMREYKKISAETGPKPFMDFKAALEAACRGRVGLPTVSIEE